MSAEVLRRAAALMRGRAEGVNYPSPWQVGDGTCDIRCNDGRVYVASTYGGVGTEEAAATHIASWHPAVALAVADWLEGVADAWANDPGCDLGGGYDFSPPCESCFRCAYYETQMRALAAARTYLGTTP